MCSRSITDRTTDRVAVERLVISVLTGFRKNYTPENSYALYIGRNDKPERERDYAAGVSARIARGCGHASCTAGCCRCREDGDEAEAPQPRLLLWRGATSRRAFHRRQHRAEDAQPGPHWTGRRALSECVLHECALCAGARDGPDRDVFAVYGRAFQRTSEYSAACGYSHLYRPSARGWL